MPLLIVKRPYRRVCVDLIKARSAAGGVATAGAEKVRMTYLPATHASRRRLPAFEVDPTPSSLPLPKSR